MKTRGFMRGPGRWVILMIGVGIVGLGVELRRLSRVKTENTVLLAQPGRQSAQDGPSPVRRLKRARPIQATPKYTIADLVAYGEATRVNLHTSAEQKEFARQRSLGICNYLESLNAAQIRALSEELFSKTNDPTSIQIIRIALDALGRKDPVAALALFSPEPDSFRTMLIRQDAVPLILADWLGKDAPAAVKWLRANLTTDSAILAAPVKVRLPGIVASHDPRLAFQLLRDMSLDDPAKIPGDIMRTGIGTALQPVPRTTISADIMRAAATGPQRTEALAALRDYMTTDGASGFNSNSAWTGLAQGLLKDGYEAASSWIEAAKLTPREMDAIASGIASAENYQDANRWVDWMNRSLSPAEAGHRVAQLITAWATKNHPAAAHAIAAMPDGPRKDLAVGLFALTVASYDPAGAAQWAMTLPDTPQRAQTLRVIHTKWPADDPEGAAEFARSHGITELATP